MVFSASLLCRASAGDFWPLMVIRLDASLWSSAGHTEYLRKGEHASQARFRMQWHLTGGVHEQGEAFGDIMKMGLD